MYLSDGELTSESVEAPVPEPPPRGEASAQARAAAIARKKLAGLPTIDLHGVKLHAITEAGCIQHVLDCLDAGVGGMVVTPNLDHLRRCLKDLRFSALVAEANLVVADGMPLIWASRLQNTPLPERVAGSDLISSLSAAAAERGRTIFLLGGAPGTAEGAARVLKERHPRLNIVGTFCPPLGFENDEEAMARIIGELVQANPDIIYVALGSPKQELLVERIRRTLPCAWWLGIGNSFSFLCGQVPRAPLWMQKSGLEWLHRLLHEPKRLFKRYIVEGVPFAARLMGQALLRGLPGRIRQRLGWTEPAKAAPPAPAVDLEPGSNGDGAVAKESAPLRRPLRPAPVNGSGHLKNLRALVLLGGAVRTGGLTTQIGRSILDLPVDEHGTILSHWERHAAEVAALAGLPRLPLRVLVNQNALEPLSGRNLAAGLLSVERDASEYRGTGGVLRDLAGDYADDDLILMANAAQIMLESVADLAGTLDERGGDISLLAHQDGTPSGLMLIRCGVLRLIGKQGFVDMKEQGLPLIAARHDVMVVNRRRPTAVPVRQLADYIVALRLYHGRRQKRSPADALGEDWRSAFSLVEEGAWVDPNAHLHDTVVLRGGRMEQGAVAVRSVVCAGGVVRRERPAVDSLVAPAGQSISENSRWRVAR